MHQISKVAKALFLSVVLVLVSVPIDVSAASAYDNVYRKTDDFTVYDNASTCGSKDIGAYWDSVIRDVKWGPTTNWVKEYRDSWISMRSSDAGYWSATAYTGTSGKRFIDILWSEGKTEPPGGWYNWSTSTVQIKSTGSKLRSVRLGYFNGSCNNGSYDGVVISASAQGSMAFSVLSSTDTNSTNIFSNFPVNYPPDYAGQTIPSEYIPKTRFKSKFLVTVVGIQVQIVTTGKDKFIPSLPQNVCATNQYTITNNSDYTDTYTAKAGTQDIGHVFEVPKLGTYKLTIIPVDCGPPFVNLPNNYVPLKTEFNLKVDGSSFHFTHNDITCDEFGNCEDIDSYEDCTLYGTDILGAIGCYINNFSKWLTATVFFLLVPDFDAIVTVFNVFIEQVKTTFGFLYAPIEFIIRLFELITTQSNNPTGASCSLGTMTLFGSSSEIQLCAWRYQFPQLWSLMQIVLKGGIAFGLIFAYWRKFTSLFGHHIEDYDDSLDDAEWFDDHTGERGSIHDNSINKRGGSR